MIQLRLAGEHNLQKFFCISFKVRQQTNLFQHSWRKILRLVDNQHRRFTRPISFEKPLIEPQENLTFGLGIAGNAKVGHHKFKKLLLVEPGIENKCCRKTFPVQPIKKLVNEGGLSGSYLSGQQNESLPALHPVS